MWSYYAVWGIEPYRSLLSLRRGNNDRRLHVPTKIKHNPLSSSTCKFFFSQHVSNHLYMPMLESSNQLKMWPLQIIAGIIPILIFVGYFLYKKDITDLHHAILGIILFAKYLSLRSWKPSTEYWDAFAVLGLIFAIVITGIITDTIKLAVGRPRPNFFWRCFPDGHAVRMNYWSELVFLHKLWWFIIIILGYFVSPMRSFSDLDYFLVVQVFSNDTGDVLCNGDEAVIKEGHKSFPSGHTSCMYY